MYCAVFIRCTTAVTHCHFLSLVVTRCITRCHSFSPVVLIVATRCNSLSLLVPLVVTGCTTRLSFYKQSKSTEKKENVEKKNKGNDKTFSLKWKYIKMKTNNPLIKKEFAIVFRALMKSLISKIYYI